MKYKDVKIGNYYVFNRPGHEAHGKSCRVIGKEKNMIEVKVGHFNQVNYKVSSGELC